MFGSTLIYVPFFINFPVQGEPVQVRDYFKGAKKQHFWGIFGGFVWSVDRLRRWSRQPCRQPYAPALAFGLIQGAPVIAALWGMLAWREFKGSTQGVKMLMLGMTVVDIAGLAMVSLAPVYSAK